MSFVVEELKYPTEEYYYLRWQVLRKPLEMPIGSEKDDFEKRSFHFAAYDSSKICAVGRLHLLDEKTAQIRYMAVADSHREKGLGSYILKEIEAKAKSMGIKKIVLNSRDSAVDFYHKHNYSIDKKGHLLNGEIQHYVMSKDID